jgi:hypothetical protein
MRVLEDAARMRRKWLRSISHSNSISLFGLAQNSWNKRWKNKFYKTLHCVIVLLEGFFEWFAQSVYNKHKNFAFAYFQFLLAKILHLVSHALNSYCLKGQCHEIFGFWFFSWISFPPAPEYTIKTVSNFFKNSWRYSQLKVCKWKNFLIRKILIILFGHLWVVEETHI